MLRRPNVGDSGRRSIEHHLQHAIRRRPAIGLVPVKVKRLDDAGVVQGGRNLRRLLRKVARKPDADALHFEEVAAIVGPKRDRSAHHPGDQLRRIRRENNIADALFAFGKFNRSFASAFVIPVAPASCCSHQIRRAQQRIERARVGPPAIEERVGHGAFRHVGVVDVGDFELVAVRGLAGA